MRAALAAPHRTLVLRLMPVAVEAAAWMLSCAPCVDGAPPVLGVPFPLPCRADDTECVRDGGLLLPSSAAEPARDGGRDGGRGGRPADMAPDSGSWCCTCV